MELTNQRKHNEDNYTLVGSSAPSRIQTLAHRVAAELLGVTRTVKSRRVDVVIKGVRPKQRRRTVSPAVDHIVQCGVCAKGRPGCISIKFPCRYFWSGA